MVNITGQDRYRPVWVVLLESIAFAGLAAMLLLLAVHRHNRFERQNFVNSFVLLNRTVGEEKRKRSRPTPPKKLKSRRPPGFLKSF